jgi:DNA-binding transcriptional regulator YdaS (Cro superfamily)
MSAHVKTLLRARGLRPVTVARLLSVNKATVSRWLSESGRIPAERVLSFELMTGISRHDLLPDLYPVRARKKRDQVPTAFPPA